MRVRELAVAVDCMVKPGEDTRSASIVGVRNGVFELSSPLALQPNDQLSLRHPERLIEARVVYCELQPSGGYLAGVVMANDAERRSEARTAVYLPATLHLAGAPSSMLVRVIDISDSGLGLEAPAALAVGASAEVELSTGLALGTIRHCATRGDVYRAGMRMREFVLAPNRRRLAVLEPPCRNTGERAIASFTRSVQERQARYEAILYSLAELGTLSCGA
jgi:hypothetical protein